jgi:hypothetical protein
MRRGRCAVCLTVLVSCSAAACGLDDGTVIGLGGEPTDDGAPTSLDGATGDGATGDSAATLSDGAADAANATETGADSAPAIELIYGVTATDLYAINPAARSATHLGAFSGCGNPVFVNDIAVDPSGTIYGLVRSDTTTSGAGLYTIASNGTCTLKHTLVDDDNHPQGIAFTAAGTLIAARDDTKDLVSIDVGTGHEAVVRGNAFPDTPTNDLICNATLCWATFSNNNCGVPAADGCYYSLNTDGTNTSQLGGTSPADAVGLAYANGKMYALDNVGGIWEIAIGIPPVATQITVTGAPASGWSGAGSAPKFL